MEDMTTSPFSFQSALVSAMVKLTAGQQVDLLEGLHQRGALDLDTANENGANLLEALSEQTFASPGLVGFLDRIGRSDLYAKPASGTWRIMDQQLLRWLPTSGIDYAERDQALAMMIAKADPGWWKALDISGDDEGSFAANKIAKLENKACESLRSLWNRGVDVHARRGPTRILAVASMRREEILDYYLAAGGRLDVNTEELVLKPVPFWRSLAQSAYHRLGGEIYRWAKQGNADLGLLETDNELRGVSLAKKNVVEMSKKLTGIKDWPHTQLMDGTPAWLWALSLRGETLKILLDKKKQQPNLQDRDLRGRGIWFWAFTHIHPDQATLEKLNLLIPGEANMRDPQGRGLITQLLEHAGNAPFKKGISKWCNPLSLLSWDGVKDRGALLDGLEQVDFLPLIIQATVSDNYQLPAPLYQLAINPETRTALTPTQRGICLCAASIFYKRMDEAGQKEWRSKREAIWADCEALGVVWPKMEPFEKIMQTMQLNSPRNLLEINIWKTGRERQEIADHTLPSGHGRMGSRRI